MIIVRPKHIVDAMMTDSYSQEVIDWYRTWSTKTDTSALAVNDEAGAEAGDQQSLETATNATTLSLSSPTAPLKNARAADEFEKFFGKRSISDKPVHVCYRDGPKPCCNDDEDSITKAITIANRYLHSRMPSAPTTNKWTKNESSQDFRCQGQRVFGKYMAPVFRDACKELHFKYEDDGTVDERKDGVDGISFSALTGKRMRTSRDFIEDQDDGYALEVVNVTTEGNRVMTYHLLECCSASLNIHKECCPLLDILHNDTSILNAIHNYLGGLVFSEDGGGRLRLVWGPDAASWEEWVAASIRSAIWAM